MFRWKPSQCSAWGLPSWSTWLTQGERGQLQRSREVNQSHCRSCSSLFSEPGRCQSEGSHRQGPPYCRRLQRKRKRIWKKGFFNSLSGIQPITSPKLHHASLITCSWEAGSEQQTHEPLGKWGFCGQAFLTELLFHDMCPFARSLHCTQHSLLPNASRWVDFPLLFYIPRTPISRFFSGIKPWDTKFAVESKCFWKNLILPGFLHF